MFKKNIYLFPVVGILLISLINSCATYDLQINGEQDPLPQKKIDHSFYLIGDAGNSPYGQKAPALKLLEKELLKANENSTVLFLGDNIYPDGMPKKESTERKFAEHQLDVQIGIVDNYDGNTIFIPGNHDWYSNGLKGLKRQENYVEKYLGKNTFLPENGCPLEKIDISDDITLIIVDSEWYLTNWDKHPTINDDCEIKTRDKFLDEFESLIKKARGKTTILAIHHPMFTNGPHGGHYDFKSHLTPLPVLGSLKNLLRKTSGVSPADLQNKRYNEFKKRLVTLSQENKKVILVSGHEHNLQYLFQDNLHQIISGSGSKLNPARNVKPGLYAQGTPGFARLDIYTDGSSFVQFFDASTSAITYKKELFSSDKTTISYPELQEDLKYKNASVYSKEETDKSGLYRFFWGERYREDYSTDIKATVVYLDTLLGGLRPIRKGGGHQSMSLRLEDNEGREYVMRALRKNALQYLQAVAFKDQYIDGKFDKTATEGLLLDVFAGSHPYAPFTIAELANSIDVLHTKPQLYYVPKQKVLGAFNNEFGDALYMIEERAADGHGNKKNFGFHNEVISTDDMLKNIKKDETHIVDESAYVRARLFDMLIGDWDRHEDQWRWAVFKQDNQTIYKPFPRDRDQAFSIMADGLIIDLATRILPGLRLMRSYEEELKSPKWFNLEPYPLDMAVLKHANRTTWIQEATTIQSKLDDIVIEQAFKNIPTETNKDFIHEIKRKLKGRRYNLIKIAEIYYEHINKFAVIRGTNKDDLFEIIRAEGDKTRVIGYRIQNGEKGIVFHDRTYSKKNTKEIWIYGLDDEDTFQVSGEGKNPVKLRLVGGQNKDTYNIQNGKRTTVYDYKSKNNEFLTDKGRKKLQDDYETNVYDYKKLKNSSNQLVPILGANPDDGFKFGFSNTTTNYGFERNPFTWQQHISTAIYMATSGFEINYSSTFANVVKNWNIEFATNYTSPNYSINFFDYGNSTVNNNHLDADNYSLDYNRVKLRQFSFSPSFVRQGDLNSILKFGLNYSTIEVDKTNGRYIAEYYDNTSKKLKYKYVGFEGKYHYANADYNAFPGMGLRFDLVGGYKNNLDLSKGFGYVIPSLHIAHKIDNSGQLVFASTVKAQLNIGDDFEFYHAANIGASEGLRGYRNQRFTGKTSFYQSSDIRWNFSNIRTAIIPLHIGVFGGFDYGRVWTPDKLLSQESNGISRWNVSSGIGFFANASDLLSFHLSVFTGDEGERLSFGLGFGF